MKELARQRIQYLIEHGGALPESGVKPLLLVAAMLSGIGDLLLLVRCLQGAL